MSGRAAQTDKTPWLRNRRTGVRRYLKQKQHRFERREGKVLLDDAPKRRIYDGYD